MCVCVSFNNKQHLCNYSITNEKEKNTPMLISFPLCYMPGSTLTFFFFLKG